MRPDAAAGDHNRAAVAAVEIVTTVAAADARGIAAALCPKRAAADADGAAVAAIAAADARAIVATGCVHRTAGDVHCAAVLAIAAAYASPESAAVGLERTRAAYGERCAFRHADARFVGTAFELVGRARREVKADGGAGRDVEGGI